jgi:hypothetical protein
MKILSKFYKTTNADKPVCRSVAGIVLAVAFILLLPLLAMQITDEVDWDLTDFVVAGALLVGTGLTYALVARKSGNIAYRSAVGVALATALIIIWINLAVGVIGTEENPANLMYYGVLAIGIIGAIIARFKSHGMSRAMFAMALALMLIAVISLRAGMHHSPGISVLKILIANGFFAALFVGSALLFRRAVREQSVP